MLKESGERQHFCLGLLAQAEACCHLGDLNAAERFLETATEIARSSKMRLHEADTNLVWALLWLKRGQFQEAWESCTKCRTIIDETGYFRRKPDLERTELQICCSVNLQCYDRSADQYEERRTQDSQQVELLANDVSEAIRRFVGVRSHRYRILELGSGSGHLTKLLTDGHAIVHALDMSTKMCLLTRQYAPAATVIEAEFLQHVFGRVRFDCVVAVSFLPLFPRSTVSRVLGKIRSLLNSDGIAFISVTVEKKTREGIFSKSDYRGDLRRYRVFYQTPDLLALVEEAGFQIEDQWHRSEQSREDKQWLVLIARRRY